jgi:hypothetical protein
MTRPATLEARVAAFEETVAKLLSKSEAAADRKDWRRTLGMFANDSMMTQIDEEGRQIRDQDRQQAQL